MKTEYNNHIEQDNSQEYLKKQALGWYYNLLPNLGITQNQTRILSRELEDIVQTCIFNGKDTPESIFRETATRVCPYIEPQVITQAIKVTPKPNKLSNKH